LSKTQFIFHQVSDNKYRLKEAKSSLGIEKSVLEEKPVMKSRIILLRITRKSRQKKQIIPARLYYIILQIIQI